MSNTRKKRKPSAPVQAVSARKFRAEKAAKTTWESLDGVIMIDTGKKRRSGKPHTVLAMRVIVCLTEADAKLVAKAYPGVKFVERTGCTLRPS